MVESIKVQKGEKREVYEALFPQIIALIEGESDTIANMSNIAAALKEAFDFFWVGFYRVVGEELVLGPFQGPVACTRIAKGKGVCGSAWEQNKTLIVPNVDFFPGHIACSSESKSEIVVPVRDIEDKVVMVLDVDSDQLEQFDNIDSEYLERIVGRLIS